MGIDHILHGSRKFFSLMDKAKICLLKVLAQLSLLNKTKKAGTNYFVSYTVLIILSFFTGNVFFLGHNLIFEVFPLY